MSDLITTRLLDDVPAEVIQEIAPGDGMYAYAPELYPEAGRAALRCIRLAMLAAGRERADRILDFASGAGRVLRYLRAAFPAAELTACDVKRSQVEFCARAFDATAVVSSLDPDEIRLEGPFDVIWCGSLLSHVDRNLFVKFLEVMQSVLAPGGVMVFTVYGRPIVDRLTSRRNMLNLTVEQADQVVRDYHETGFGFQPVAGTEDERYGECVASPAWVCAQLNEATPDLSLLMYAEGAWLAQDAVVCTKRRQRSSSTAPARAPRRSRRSHPPSAPRSAPRA